MGPPGNEYSSGAATAEPAGGGGGVGTRLIGTAGATAVCNPPTQADNKPPDCNCAETAGRGGGGGGGGGLRHGCNVAGCKAVGPAAACLERRDGSWHTLCEDANWRNAWTRRLSVVWLAATA